MYSTNENFPTLEEYLKINQHAHKDNIFCRYLSGSFIYKPNTTKMDDKIFERAVKNLEYFNCIFIIEKSKEGLNLLSKKQQEIYLKITQSIQEYGKKL